MKWLDLNLQHLVDLIKRCLQDSSPDSIAQDTQNSFLDSGRLEGLKSDTNHSSEPSSHPASHIDANTKNNISNH